jgi:hypothetical protein
MSQGKLEWLKACFKSRLGQPGVPIYLIHPVISEEIDRCFFRVS